MEPSTMLSILLSLICLALMVYLPKLRNTVLWILFPPAMLLVRYPKTRKPALGLVGVLAVVIGIVVAWNEYQRRTYWYCDVWRFKDRSQISGRKSDTSMTCYKGEAACKKAADQDAATTEGATFLREVSENVGEPCSQTYKSLWTYGYTVHSDATATHAAWDFEGVEQFTTFEECQAGRSQNLKDRPSSCSLAK